MSIKQLQLDNVLVCVCSSKDIETHFISSEALPEYLVNILHACSALSVNQTITTQQARTQATTISFHFLTFFLESTIFYNCPTFFLESTISYHFPTFFLESTLPLVVFHLLHRSPGLPTVRSHLTYSVVTLFENWMETCNVDE